MTPTLRRGHSRVSLSGIYCHKKMVKKVSKIFVVIIFNFILIRAVFAAEDITKDKRRIAVFPFEINSPKEQDKFLSAAFSDTLTSALSQVNDLILTERGELKKLLEEQKLGQTGIIDPETAARTGKILGARTAVLGAYNRIGEKVRATCRFVDVNTGEVDKIHIVKVDKLLTREEDIFDIMDELAKMLLDTFNIRPTTEEVAKMEIRTEPTKDFSAYEYFMKGREKFLSQSYEEAVPLFEKAVNSDKNYALAYACLSETYLYWGWQRGSQSKESEKYYTRAKECFKEAVRLKPELEMSRIGIGVPPKGLSSQQSKDASFISATLSALQRFASELGKVDFVGGVTIEQALDDTAELTAIYNHTFSPTGFIYRNKSVVKNAYLVKDESALYLSPKLYNKGIEILAEDAVLKKPEIGKISINKVREALEKNGLEFKEVEFLKDNGCIVTLSMINIPKIKTEIVK